MGKYAHRPFAESLFEFYRRVNCAFPGSAPSARRPRKAPLTRLPIFAVAQPPV